MLIFQVVTLLVLGWMFTRWLILKKEIRNVTAQLTQYRQSSSMKKVDITFIEKDFEQLVVEVNFLMDMISQEKADKRRTEHELKQAIANISHDLRTPLTSILGNLQLMNGKDVTMDERIEYQRVALSRGNRLKSLLNDFFELSIIESVDYELSLEQVNMNDVVTEALLGFYDCFTEKEIVPSVTMPDQPLAVITDESAIKRVIENLINNAISHGEGNVTISLERQERHVRLVVSNEVGMPIDTSMIFDRFYTADQVRAGRGKGLGLSITKGLMDKMKGSVKAEYENGQIHLICDWVEFRLE